MNDKITREHELLGDWWLGDFYATIELLLQ